MAKDYAKPHSTAKGSPNADLPRWGWFSVGFSFGLFAAFLIYLWQLVPVDEASNLDKPTAELVEPGGAGQTEDEAEEELELEFYDLFPNQKVPIVEEYKGHNKVSIPVPRRYALQAGAFKLRADADRLRGELILMGLKVHVRSITAKDGNQWHRVIIGPFKAKLALNRTKTLLSQNNIQSITLRIK